jgi:hypothetical protein
MPLLEKIYDLERAGKVSIMPFFYSNSFANSVLTSGAVVPQTTNIQSDSHFIVRYFTITTYTTGLVVATATSPLLIQFFDTGSGRTLFDNPQPIQNVMGGAAAAAGVGALPFILPEPWLLRAGGTVQITITNLGASTVNRADVSMPGMKVFQFGTSQPPTEL